MTQAEGGTEPRPRWRPWNFTNWSIRSKLLGVVALPVVAALVGGTLLVTGLRETASDLDYQARVSEAQRAALDVVGELNAEELLVASELAGVDVGELGLPDRGEQIRRTDDAAERLRGLSAGVFDTDTAIDDPVLAIDASLDLVQFFRTSAAASGGEVGPVVGPYAAAANSAEVFAERLSDLLSDQELRAGAVTAQTLSSANQDSATEAVLLLSAATDGPDAVDPGDLAAASAARAEAVTDFQGLVGFVEERDYRTATRDAEQARGARLESAEADTPGGDVPPGAPLPPAGEYATVVVAAEGAAEELRERLSADQLGAATAARDSANDRTNLLTVAMLTLLALGVVITFLAIRSIVRQLRALRAGALEVATVRLPAVIARIRDGDTVAAVDPVDVHTTEETGQVARAFDEVHEEAVRLAREQEDLRRTNDRILVSLARRSSALMGRQLSIIDRLENQERDPDQLSQLFRLDHLASRMRRNNDNVMVLAGAGGTRSGKPLPVLDVLRAAVSETEDYERITVDTDSPAVVTASVAQDLVHLVAELLDNAASFSPPTTRVTVSAQGGGDGLVLTIVDRGVGLTPREYDELNRKLALAPVVDDGVTRRMGLFVVSRLAQRHNLRVHLQQGPFETGVPAERRPGVEVRVVLPADVLVRPPAEYDGSFPDAQELPVRRRDVGTRTNGHDWPAPVPPRVAEDAPRSVETDAPTPRAPLPPALPTRRLLPPSPAPTSAPRPAPTSAPRPAPLPVAPEPTPSGPPAPASAPPAPAVFHHLSAWFDDFDATLAAAADPTVSDPGRRSPAPAVSTATAAAPAPAPDPTPPTFDSGADEGWRAVAAVESDDVQEISPVGLPRRRPRANLVPGSAPPNRTTPPARARAGAPRRSQLGTFQRGVRRGRDVARADPDEVPVPDEQPRRTPPDEQGQD